MIHSFLLIGQSNMASRGFLNEVDPIKNKNLFVLRNGRWRSISRCCKHNHIRRMDDPNDL